MQISDGVFLLDKSNLRLKESPNFKSQTHIFEKTLETCCIGQNCIRIVRKGSFVQAISTDIRPFKETVKILLFGFDK